MNEKTTKEMNEDIENIINNKLLEYIKENFKNAIIELLLKLQKENKKFEIITIDGNIIYGNDFDTPLHGRDYENYFNLYNDGKVVGKIYYDTILEIRGYWGVKNEWRRNKFIL